MPLSAIRTHDPSVRESEDSVYVLDRAATVTGLTHALAVELQTMRTRPSFTAA
jgi:hypothetical protein